MVHTTKLRVDFQRNVREILILLVRRSEGLFELHVNGVDTQFDVADSLFMDMVISGRNNQQSA
jgi:hypothetical protein